MSKHLSTLLTNKARELGNAYIGINDDENAIFKAQGELWCKRQRFIEEAKAFLAVMEESPELLPADIEYATTCIRQTLESFQRQDKVSPIEKLLNFATMGAKKDESFLLSEVYELIGKDDARSLKSRLRDVIALIDPARARSF